MVVPTTIQIKELQLYRGAKFNVADKCAKLVLLLNADLGGVQTNELQRWTKTVRDLLPSETQLDHLTTCWPDDFVIDANKGDSASHFAAWIVALAIAFQRWARDPVSRGQVVATDGQNITVALP